MKPIKWTYSIFGLLALLLSGASASAASGLSPYPFKGIGDGKKATEVILAWVDRVAADSEGNLFISHRSKNRIRKVGKDGIITTIADNGRAGFSGDNGPAVLTVDGNSNVGWLQDGLEVRITVNNFS